MCLYKLENPDLLKTCFMWAERADEITMVEALTLLTEFYMKQCGKSLLLRSLINEAGEYWLFYFRQSDHPLAEYATTASFLQIMPEFSEEFKRNRAQLWRNDITKLDIESAEKGAREILSDDTLNEKLKIAFAQGFIPYYSFIIEQYNIKLNIPR